MDKSSTISYLENELRNNNWKVLNFSDYLKENKQLNTRTEDKGYLVLRQCSVSFREFTYNIDYILLNNDDEVVGYIFVVEDMTLTQQTLFLEYAKKAIATLRQLFFEDKICISPQNDPIILYNNNESCWYKNKYGTMFHVEKELSMSDIRKIIND